MMRRMGSPVVVAAAAASSSSVPFKKALQSPRGYAGAGPFAWRHNGEGGYQMRSPYHQSMQDRSTPSLNLEDLFRDFQRQQATSELDHGRNQSTAPRPTTPAPSCMSAEKPSPYYVSRRGNKGGGQGPSASTFNTSSPPPQSEQPCKPEQDTSCGTPQEKKRECHASSSGSSGVNHHPFMNLFESLGAVSPLTIHESVNHSTVEVELPTNVEVKNPKVVVHNGNENTRDVNRGRGGKSGESLSEFVQILTGQHPKQHKDGNVTVSAELTPKLSLEQKVQQKQQSDKMKVMLQQLGLPVEHIDLHSGVASAVKNFERTFYIDEKVYDLSQATPFVEEGMLRLYVPKKKITATADTPIPATPAPAAAAAPTQQQQPLGDAQKQQVDTTTTSPTPAPSSSPKTVLDWKSLIPNDVLPQQPSQAVVSEKSSTTTTTTPSVPPVPAANMDELDNGPRFSWANSGRNVAPTTTLSSKGEDPSAATSSQDQAGPAAPLTMPSSASGSWPPVVNTSETVQATTHSISIPLAVDADTIALDIIESGAPITSQADRRALESTTGSTPPTSSGSTPTATTRSMLKLTIQQSETISEGTNQEESVVRTLSRYFEVLPGVDVDTVTCEFNDESRELTVCVPKPEPKRTASPRVRRININKNSK